MRLFSICRNCAEVHPVETACPACHPLPHMAAATGRTPPYRRAHDEAAPLPAAPANHRNTYAGMTNRVGSALEPARSRGMWRASTVVVSAYVLAVVVLILAVFAQA